MFGNTRGMQIAGCVGVAEEYICAQSSERLEAVEVEGVILLNEDMVVSGCLLLCSAEEVQFFLSSVISYLSF